MIISFFMPLKINTNKKKKKEEEEIRRRKKKDRMWSLMSMDRNAVDSIKSGGDVVVQTCPKAIRLTILV